MSQERDRAKSIKGAGAGVDMVVGVDSGHSSYLHLFPQYNKWYWLVFIKCLLCAKNQFFNRLKKNPSNNSSSQAKNICVLSGS